MLTDILFLRQDDGTFLAIHISSTRGRDLLRLHRELTAQIGTPTYQTTPPFGLNTVYEDRSSGAQTPTLKDNEPSIPASSAPTVQPPAKVSTDSSLDPRTGFSSTDVWMDTIFSSADGQSYDRDWIKIHNVNDSILKGIPSKHKLDLLVRFGAVVVGDKLCVTYHSLGYPVIREGEVRLDL